MIDLTPYTPLCRECVSRRNGRLRLAGGPERGLGPVHYRLDGGRAVLMVRRQGAPCVECGRLTHRFYRAVALADLFAVEVTGQLSFVPRRRVPRPRRSAPALADFPPPQLSFLSDKVPEYS